MTGYVIFDGFNADDIDADELDGAGTNEPVWPAYLDSFAGFASLLITAEMMAAFDGCPDFVAQCNENVLTIAPEQQVVVIRGNR